MGIDKIGKKGGVEGASSAEGTGDAAPVEKSFAEVHAEKSGAAQGAQATGGVTPLDRLRAGEIDVNGYVDAQIEKATAGLKGLSETQRGSIRSVLREQMLTDPGLSELVHKATGQLPSVPEE